MAGKNNIVKAVCVTSCPLFVLTNFNTILVKVQLISKIRLTLRLVISCLVLDLLFSTKEIMMFRT